MKSFKFIKQLDAMQCGIACMAMICKYWGKNYSLRFLADYCKASKEGVSFKSMADLSEKLGLDYVSGKVSIQELNDCPLPAILHWNQNHFVVLYDIKKNKYRIADPAKGKMTLKKKNLRAILSL